MYEEHPRAPSLHSPLPSSPRDETDRLTGEDVSAEAVSPRPIVFATFARPDSAPSYRGSAIFSIVLHLSLIGLTLWLNRKVILPHTEPMAVLFRHPPPPRPPPQPETKPETLRKGGRGIALPKAVAKDVQPEYELSFAASLEPETKGPTGRWLGGVGAGEASGPGWADGVEGGVVIRRSRARDPQEENTGWPCTFPEQEADNRLVVRIRVHVNDSGRPTHVTVIRPGPKAFNDSAIECAMNERFHPALDINGNPCEGDREVGILFFRTGVRPQEAAAKPRPPPPPPPPPLTGPQPDLPVQLDDSPDPSDPPPTGG